MAMQVALGLLAVACGAAGEGRITGFTYSCPAVYLSERYADKTGRMLADGKTGPGQDVIYYRTHTPTITVALPGSYRIGRVVVHLHRHNNNYKCYRVQLFAQQAGLWVMTDEQPGFIEPYDPTRRSFRIELEGKGVTTEALRIVFATAGILAISEIEVLGAPAAGQTAQTARIKPVSRASVREIDVDRDGKLDLVLENRWVRLVVSPARGGVVRSFVYKPTGAELVWAQGANYGLLREQLWKPRYFLADNPCVAEHGGGKGRAWVETRITGVGGMMGFTHSRKRIELSDAGPVVSVEWELRNDPSSMTEYEYGPWIHNWVGTSRGIKHYFVPTVEGVKEFVLRPGGLKKQANVWYWEPARGWMGVVNEREEGREPVGLVFVVPYRNLACFYHWAGVSSVAATAEWRHGLVKLRPGQSFAARYVIVPFAGLSRVDGVCAAADSQAIGNRVRPVLAIGEIDGSTSQAGVAVKVRVFQPAGAPACEVAARWRVYPNGQWHQLDRKPLKRAAVTQVFDGVLKGAEGKAVVVNCQVYCGGKLVGEFERFFNFSQTHVAYRLEPLEERTVRVEAAPVGLPKHDLQRTVVTPHVPWARPYARGPIRALVLCDDQNAREVVELAQRLEMDFTYIKFRTTREKQWIYQGDRTVPNLETAQKRLLAALDEPMDVAIIAGFDWQVHFTPQIRRKLAEKVRGGMGLVAIEPCGVPADDPLAEVLGVSKKNRPLAAFSVWASPRTHYITRGLWWPWDGLGYERLIPKTRRMEYEAWPRGQVLATFKKDGAPLIVAGRVGKGRVVTATYDVLTHSMDYRGFSGLTPAISYRGRLLLDEFRQMTWPYWEHWWVLITRMAVWAARREGPVQIGQLSARVDERGHIMARVSLTGKASRSLRIVLQAVDRYGVPLGKSGMGEAAPDMLRTGIWTAQMLRGPGRIDEMDILRPGSLEVDAGGKGQADVDLGLARAGWNFVRCVVRDAASGAAVDWGMTAVKNAKSAIAIDALEVDRDPVTDCRLLVEQQQPWARVFAPTKALALKVHLRGVLPLEPGWRVRAELYDTHGRLVFAREQPVASLSQPVAFQCLPHALYNMGLEWCVQVARGEGGERRLADQARRRLLALPPRVWRRFSFTSWSVNFLWRSYWLQQFLVPIAEELGIDVGMTSSTELAAGKPYRNKWHNIRHSYIGLLDHPGRKVPGFRDRKFADKAAKYSQTHDKSYLVREPCLNDPEYRAKLATALKERIREAAAIGPSYDYCMGDEMSLTHYTRYFDYCFSPHCLGRFRQWLRDRYKSLAALNKAWGTQFGSWDEVMPMTLDEVRGRANAAPWAEFRTFMNDTLADFYGFVQQTIREVDPEAKCGLSGTQEPKPGNGMDWWKLSRAFSYYHSYNTGWSNEMRRSFARATGVMQSPYYAGYWQSGRGLEYNMFWCLLHDTKGISCWTTPLLIYPDFTLTEAGADTRRLIHELRDGVWELVRAGKRVRGPIALHYSQPSINAALLIDHDRHIVKVRHAWVKLIEDLGLQYEFVSYEQVEEGELEKAGYRVLILPESIALSDREVDRITQFAAAGGTVIADGWCGVMDERCRRRQRPALDDLFGLARGKDVHLADSVEVSQLLLGEPLTLRLRVADTDVRTGRRAFASSGGVPALVQARVGKGTAWYLNLDLSSWPLDRQARSPNEALVRRVVGAVLKDVGVVPPVAVSSESGRPPHVEVVRYELGAGMMVGLLRDKADREHEVITAKWGRPMHVYDVRAHRYLGQRSAVSLPMAPGECRLLLLTRARLRPLLLTVSPAAVEKGGRLTVTVARRGKSGTPQMVRVAMAKPDDHEALDYTRLVLVKDKPVRYSVQLALNDETGRWTVSALDVASGQVATGTVRLR